MKHAIFAPRISPLAILAATVLLVAPGASIAAPSQRTFVASYGNDANPNCNLAFPCRSFTAAIAQTKPGGEVVVLDTAAYGPMVINQAIKIIGPSGVYGGISVLGGVGNPTTGIVINAGDTDVVTLRGLDIAGVPGSAPLPRYGIDIQNVGTVNIEKTSIANFTQDGTTSACINVVSAKPIKVFVNDSFLRECVVGIWVNGIGPDDASRINLVVDNTRIQDSLNTVLPSETAALVLSDAVVASIRNSVLSWGGDGIYASNGNAAVKNRIHVLNTHFSRFGFAAIETDGAAGGNLHVNVSLSHFNNNNAALLHRHGQVILTSNVIANHTFSLVDCGGGAASVTSLGYSAGNGSNSLSNNTDVGPPWPSGCSGPIITPTQFAGK